MGEIQNLVLLALCWACTLSSSTLLTSVGPLTAEQLGAPESLAPLAVACFLFGAAITSVPSAWIFRRCGRRGGFLIGSALIVASGGAGVAGLRLGELWLIYGATLLAGLGQGFGQFYRFAAMEVCTPARKPFAVTLVLSGGVLAAFAGPQLSVWAAPLVGPHHTGCFLVVSAIGLLNGVVAASVRYAPEASVGHEAASPMLSAEVGGMALPPPVPLARLMAQPRCVVAVAMATAAHTSMVMLMSPLTVAMRNAGLSAQLGDLALEVHFFCMFAPGFVSGRLIGAAGPARTALLGVALFAGAAAILASGEALTNFVAGMALVGVSWNLCFSAGTVMLASCYALEDAPRVQGANDFVIFFTAGGGSTASGFVYSAWGWAGLVYLVSGVMAALLGLLLAFLLLDRGAAAAASEGGAEEDARRGAWGERGKPGDEGVPRVLSLASVLSSAASEASDACSLRASIASEAVFQPRLADCEQQWQPGGSSSSLPRPGDC